MARDRALPDGWRIVALMYDNGPKGWDVTPVNKGDRIDDKDVAGADSIRVAYTSRRTGVTTHRTVHGAVSKAAVGDYIVDVTRVVSPT